MTARPFPCLLLLAGCTVGSEPWAQAPSPLGGAAEKDLCGDQDDADWVESEVFATPEWTDPVGELMGVYDTGSVRTYCSGTLIGPDLLLTAGHCLDPITLDSEGAYTWPDGTERPASPEDICSWTSVTFEDEDHGGTDASVADLPRYACTEVLAKWLTSSDGGTTNDDYALIRLAGEPGNTYGWREMDFRRPSVGETVYIVGHPGNTDSVNGDEDGKKVSQGVVTQVDGEAVWYDADSWGGMSGGAIFDAAGRLLGEHTNGLCNEEAGNKGRLLIDLYGDIPELAEHDYFDQRESGNVEAYDLYGAALASGDFDGDGYDDLAIGSPWETYGSTGASLAGYVSVRPGGPYGLEPAGEYGFLQGTGTEPETTDLFGSVLAAGDFDGDGYDDLAVGVPDEDYGFTNAGLVNIYWGSSAGLDEASPTTLSESYGGGTRAANNDFGAALAVGDVNGDGYDDLAVGAPGVSSDAGKVYVIRGSASGMTTTGRTSVQQDRGGGNIEGGDRFGATLAMGDFNNDGYADLAVGAPTEDHPTYGVDSGYVSVWHGSSSGVVRTSGYGMSEGDTTAAAGDLFGSSLAVADVNGDGNDDLVMGAPGKASGSATGAGRVAWRRGRSTGLKGNWYGMTQSPTGSVESGDAFGTAVAAGDLDGDGRADLVAGAPGETVSAGPTGGGWLMLAYGTGSTFSTSNTDGVSQDDVAPAGDNDAFGTVISLGDFDGDGDLDVAVGMPWEDGIGGETQSGAVIVYDVE